MAKIQKETVLTARLPHEDFTVDGQGDVRIRALSRAEALQLPDDEVDKEAHILSLGVVEPAFTVTEARRWLASSPAGELQSLSRRIAELSGMLAGAPQAAYKSDGGEPDPRI